MQDKFNKETILIDTGGRLALPQESWQKPQSQTNAEKHSFHILNLLE
ncbi:hypothetical protein ACGO3R_04760 [Lactococcus lactis]